MRLCLWRVARRGFELETEEQWGLTCVGGKARQARLLSASRFAEHLAAKGELLRGGTIVDATLIAASPSTKNAAQQRDLEMSQSKKGNQWYFGMKAHVGVDAKSGLVHTAGVTTDKVHDAKVMANLIREDDTAVYGDKGMRAMRRSGQRKSPACSGR